MSLQTILKNVYNFVDILQTACSDQVVDWDEDELNNALKWAKYCKQIYIQGKGKPYEEELNQHVLEIGQLPWAIGNRKIDLQALNFAENTLRQALLENPHLSSATYDHLLLTYGNPSESPPQLLEDLKALKTSKQYSDLSSKLLLLQQGDDSVVLSPHQQTSAKLILQYVQLLVTQKPSRKERCEEILRQKLESVSSEKQGLDILCIASCLTCTEMESAQSFIVSWLIEKPQCKLVFGLTAALLAEVCLVHFTFFQSYLRHIWNLTKKVQSDIDGIGIVNYRLPRGVSYESILTRMTALINSNEPVASAVKKTINSFAISDNTGFWRQISHATTKSKNKCD